MSVIRSKERGKHFIGPNEKHFVSEGTRKLVNSLMKFIEVITTTTTTPTGTTRFLNAFGAD
jgi:hypothetical protein